MGLHYNPCISCEAKTLSTCYGASGLTCRSVGSGLDDHWSRRGQGRGLRFPRENTTHEGLADDDTADDHEASGDDAFGRDLVDVLDGLFDVVLHLLLLCLIECTTYYTPCYSCETKTLSTCLRRFGLLLLTVYDYLYNRTQQNYCDDIHGGVSFLVGSLYPMYFLRKTIPFDIIAGYCFDSVGGYLLVVLLWLFRRAVFLLFTLMQLPIHIANSTMRKVWPVAVVGLRTDFSIR